MHLRRDFYLRILKHELAPNLHSKSCTRKENLKSFKHRTEEMGKQIGSDEMPITFRSPIYKNTHGSKGANPRPGFYTQDYRDNWDRIFGKKKTEENKD